MNTYKIHWSTVAFLIIAGYLIISNFVFAPHQIISYDIYGYYLYLPQTFIYHDLSIHNPSQVLGLMEQYNSSSTFYQASLLPDGTYVMKYSMGLAILYAPFFFIAHIMAPILGFAADGYSLPYQVSLLIGGIIYSIAGFWFLRKVLLKYFNKNITAIALLLIVAGTNIPIHMAMYGQNAMSHNYLFALYCMALWFTIKWHDTFQLKYIIVLGIICGLAILSRPTEIVILAIPLLWNIGSRNALKEKFNIITKHSRQIAVFSIIILALGFTQLLYWKLHTGHFLYYSYGSNPGEGMEFISPFITDVLFSFRKGWFVYTPLMLLASTGFIFIYKKNRKIFWPLLVYTCINLYLISCWSTWWYAQSYSQRPLVPALAVMSIPLAYFLSWVSDRKLFLKTILSTVIGLIIFLNVFQIWQFHTGILSGDRMTKDYYKKIFLRTSVSDEDRKLMLLDRWYYELNGFDNEQEYTGKIIKTLGFEDGGVIDSIPAIEGTRYCILDKADSYSPVIDIPYDNLTTKDHAWLRIRVKVFPVTRTDSDRFALVMHFSFNGFAYQYKSVESPALNLKLNEWNDISFDYLTPEVRRKNDIFRTFVWNITGAPVLVDALSVEVFEPRD